MNPEPEEDDLGEFTVYDPEPVSLADGEMLILDPLLFAEQHNTNCVRMTGSQVWVLDNDTRKWRDIETRQKARGEVRALKP